MLPNGEACLMFHLRQRSEAEFRELYATSGFELTRIVPTPGRVSVIEGVPR